MAIYKKVMHILMFGRVCHPDKAKPIVRWGRKAMDPREGGESRVAGSGRPAFFIGSMFTIAGYHIAECLYEGTHSLVYRARRSADNTPVVLKVLRNEYPTPTELARFTREYAMTRSLAEVEGVIQVYGLERHQQTLLMVLEDFGGESLARWWSDEHPVILNEAVS